MNRRPFIWALCNQQEKSERPVDDTDECVRGVTEQEKKVEQTLTAVLVGTFGLHRSRKEVIEQLAAVDQEWKVDIFG